MDETPQLWSEFHNGTIIQRRIGNKNSDEANDNVRGTTPGVATRYKNIHWKVYYPRAVARGGSGGSNNPPPPEE